MSDHMEQNHAAQSEPDKNQTDKNGMDKKEANGKETNEKIIALKDILQQVAEKENLRDYELVLTDTSNKGDGYLGLINFCQIKGTTAEGKPIVLDLVVKSASKNKKLRSDIPVRHAFITENYHYGVIHPRFRQIQEECNISEPFDSIAKCFLIIEDEYQEAMVLKNLKSEGYGLWHRQKPMDEEHVTLVMQQYGKFHALSYALRQIDEQAFLKLASELKYDVVTEFFIKSEKSLMKLFDGLIKSFDKKKDVLLIERVSKFKSSLMKFLREETTKTDQYSVISHGDCWMNNMMFKYESNSEPLKPSAMCFLDFQCSRLTSPAFDIVYFFHACSSMDTIRQTERFLQIYYDSLKNHLQKFGGDMSKLIPFDELKEQWKNLCWRGFLHGFLAYKVQVSEIEELPQNFSVAAEGGNGEGGNAEDGNAKDGNVVEKESSTTNPEETDPMNVFNYEIAREGEYYQRVKELVVHLVANDFL